ncbi:MAG: polysaccharide deacetylase family protein [Armatimonadetes bacterium]|nr:polysaccharide deacetylase family protein [Armatimonadota bacterium]
MPESDCTELMHRGIAPTVALKIDVDTLQGYREGVPRLADVLSARSIRATFCVAMGPDKSGQAIRRVFRQRGFLQKMLRTRAASIYSWRTRLYGLLLPAPLIAASDPLLIRNLVDAGFEVIPHGWDHVSWHDFLKRWRAERVMSELKCACLEFQRRAGMRCHAFAAPGWQASDASLIAEEELGLEYGADTRGWRPFYPVTAGGRVIRVPQLPTTLPTADELIGRVVGDADGLVEHLRRLILSQPRLEAEGVPPPDQGDDVTSAPLHVFTLHAEIEGGPWLDAFARLLDALLSDGTEFLTLRELARRALAGGPLPECRVVDAVLPGRAGTVSCQSCSAPDRA